MTRSYKDFLHWKVTTTDGHERPVADVLLDDRGWSVRYVLVETGGWLHGRQLLISSAAFGAPDSREHVLPIQATLNQMEKSPPLKSHMPVTLAHERALEEYYEWPPREAEGSVLPESVTRQLTPDTQALQDRTVDRHTKPIAGEAHLWSAGALLKMKAVTRDRQKSGLDDVLLSEDLHHVAGWIVDARPWMPGGEAMLGPSAVSGVDLNDGVVSLVLERTEIEGLAAAQANLAAAKGR